MNIDFEAAMMKHFEEDNKNFGEINTKTDKLSEQMTINGEHMSHFNKNLLEIKDTLQKHILHEESRYKRIEPIVIEYWENKDFNKELNVRAKKWGSRVTWTAATITALYVLKKALLDILLK